MTKYQLVLQFPADSIADYDAMIRLEDTIAKNLGRFGFVDGHDAGAGEMNIFILTEHPKLAFERVQQTMGNRGLFPKLKAAYRDIEKDEYLIVHPDGLERFAVT